MNQTTHTKRGKVCVTNDQLQLSHKLISTLRELGATSGSDGVTVERLQCVPHLPTSEIAELLDQLYEDGIIEQVKLNPHYKGKPSRCNSKTMWAQKPRYRLRK